MADLIILLPQMGSFTASLPLIWVILNGTIALGIPKTAALN